MGSMLAAFLRSRRGAVAVTYGLAALPLLIGVGAAVDYRNQLIAQRQLNEALDASLLSAARVYAASTGLGETARQAESTAAGRAIFFQNVADTRVQVENMQLALSFNPALVEVRGTVTGRSPLFFATLLGFDAFQLGSQAAAQGADQRRVEVVLALDNTGSMDQANRMTLMRAAAQNFVDFLFDNAAPDRLYISVVPWSYTVNIAGEIPQGTFDPTPYAETQFGIEGVPMQFWPEPREEQLAYISLPQRHRRYSLRGGQPANSTTIPNFSDDDDDDDDDLQPGDESFASKSNRQLFEETFNGFGWRGCLRSAPNERAVNNQSAVTVRLTDAPPPTFRFGAFAVETGLFFSDGRTPASQITITDASDAQWGCPAPMLGLSANRRQVKEALERMRPEGFTYQDLGLMWGLRMLSPRSEWVNFFGHTGQNRPAPFDPNQTRKILILLTDGMNAAHVQQQQSVESYWGCEWQRNNNNTNLRNGAGGCWLANGFGNQLEDATVDNLTLDACTAVRDDYNIELYTIAVDVTEANAIQLLRTCAGQNDRFENISAAQIGSVLLTIAEESLRITE